MILVEIHFGNSKNASRKELRNLVESYCAALMHAGQIGLEYFIRWIDGKLVCCALVAGLGGAKPRFHSDWGRRDLEKVIEVFGKPPEWIVRDDDSPRRNTSWKAPTLHLF